MWFRLAVLTLIGVTVLVPPLGGVPRTVRYRGVPDEPQKKPRLSDQFLIFGTVFEESGFLLPGAEIQVRRGGEKKVRWRQISDRSGEFAVRVPPGAEYELTVKAKGFEEQSRKIDARTGNREDLIIRMKPLPEGKKR
jgi:hypothetical protein